MAASRKPFRSAQGRLRSVQISAVGLILQVFRPERLRAAQVPEATSVRMVL